MVTTLECRGLPQRASPTAPAEHAFWLTTRPTGPAAYRSVFDAMLPDATQIADPFHLVKLANSKRDECHRRVQNETLGHRGRKADPLYRARRLLTKAHERLDDRGEAKLTGLLAAGDPRGEVRMAWHAKEVLRSIYDSEAPWASWRLLTLVLSSSPHVGASDSHNMRTTTRGLSSGGGSPVLVGRWGPGPKPETPVGSHPRRSPG